MKTGSLVGTAGWSVDRSLAQFPAQGSALERYGAVMGAVEVNTSFYRRHRPTTWQRWHDAVPAHFRFSVKLGRSITHERGLEDAEEALHVFAADVAPLGEKLGAILIQLPPKLVFDARVVPSFFEALALRCRVPAFIEPRHVSWAAPEASAVLERFEVGRVFADPQDELLQAAAGSAPPYLRLHGSPKIYYSRYEDDRIAQFARMLEQRAVPAWCIFDNTASGAALGDALRLREVLSEAGKR